MDINDLKPGVVITYNGEPYRILKSQHSKTAMRRAVMQTKMQHLVTGAALEATFKGNEDVALADFQKEKAQFLYRDDTSFVFMRSETFEQFSFSDAQIGDRASFLREGTEADILFLEGKPINIDLPIKMDFKVVIAPPGIKGDTATGATKQVTIDTGAEISAPLFVKEGDTILIDTRDGSYVERVAG